MKRNTSYFFVYAFFWLAYSFFCPYLGVIYVQKGLNGIQIGVLSALESIALTVSGLFLGRVMDRFGHPKVVTMILPLLSAAACLFLCKSSSFPLILTATALFFFFQSPFNAVIDRLLIARLHDRPDQFAHFRAGGSIGYGIGSLLMGGILIGFGSQLSCLLYGIGMLLTTAFTAALPLPESAGTGKTPMRLSLSQLWIGRKTLFIYGTVLIYFLLEGSFGRFMALQVVGSGLDVSFTGLLIASAMIGEFVCFLLLPSLSKKCSAHARLVLAFFLMTLRIAALTFVTVWPKALVLLAHLLGGCAFAIVYTALTGMIENAFPPDFGYTAQALKSIVSNFASIIGILLLSLFYQYGCLHRGFLLMTLLSCACLVLYIFFWLSHVNREIIDND